MRHNVLTLKLSKAAKLQTLENKLQELNPMTREEIYAATVLSHTFLNGTYTRVAILPKGAVGVGKIHRHPNVTTILQGAALVVSDNAPVRLVKAGDQYTVPANNRNAFLAIEDLKFSTFHRTGATTPEEAEEDLIIPSTTQQFKELATLLKIKE